MAILTKLLKTLCLQSRVFQNCELDYGYDGKLKANVWYLNWICWPQNKLNDAYPRNNVQTVVNDDSNLEALIFSVLGAFMIAVSSFCGVDIITEVLLQRKQQELIEIPRVNMPRKIRRKASN